MEGFLEGGGWLASPRVTNMSSGCEAGRDCSRWGNCTDFFHFEVGMQWLYMHILQVANATLFKKKTLISHEISERKSWFLRANYCSTLEIVITAFLLLCFWWVRVWGMLRLVTDLLNSGSSWRCCRSIDQPKLVNLQRVNDPKRRSCSPNAYLNWSAHTHAHVKINRLSTMII